MAGHRITLGEDKAYDTADHVAHLRRYERYAACDAEQRHHRNRQASSERHRRTHQCGMKATVCRDRAGR